MIRRVARGVAVAALLAPALLLVSQPAAHGLVLECPSTLGPWVFVPGSGRIETDGHIHGMECDYTDDSGFTIYSLHAFWNEPGDKGGTDGYCTKPDENLGDSVASHTRSALVYYGNNDKLQIPADAQRKSAQLLADIESVAALCPGGVTALAPSSPVTVGDVQTPAAPAPTAAPIPLPIPQPSHHGGGGYGGLGIALALLGAIGVATPLTVKWTRGHRTGRGHAADGDAAPARPQPDLSPQPGDGVAPGRMFGEWMMRSVVDAKSPKADVSSKHEAAPKQ